MQELPSLAVRRRGTLVNVLVRFRYPLLTAWTAIWAKLIYDIHAGVPGDYFLLAYGGRALTGNMSSYHAGALHLYSTHPMLQVGSPALLVVGGLIKLTRTYNQALTGVLIVACGLVTVRAIEVTAVRLGLDSRRAAGRTLVVGAVTLAGWAWIEEFFHVEDAMALTALFCAMSVIVGRRPHAWWLAGLLLGFGVACKPWLLMAMPALAGLARRDWPRAGAVAVASAAIWWLPFVVADPGTVAALTGYPQGMGGESGLRGLGWSPMMAPPGVHLMMYVTGLGFATIVVGRRHWLAVPLAAFAARALFEPRFFLYYGAASLAAAALWDLSYQRRVPRWTLVTAVLEFVIPHFGPDRLGAESQVAFVALVVAFVVFRRTSGTSSPRVGAVAAPPRKPAVAGSLVGP